MPGMSRDTGGALDRLTHLRQSIADILSTPIGSRVHRRDYGSNLPRLVDRPINQSLVADLIAATAEALNRWEPRIRVDRVVIESAVAGSVTLSVYATHLIDGKPVSFRNVVIQ